MKHILNHFQESHKMTGRHCSTATEIYNRNMIQPFSKLTKHRPERDSTRQKTSSQAPIWKAGKLAIWKIEKLTSLYDNVVANRATL